MRRLTNEDIKRRNGHYFSTQLLIRMGLHIGGIRHAVTSLQKSKLFYHVQTAF